MANSWFFQARDYYFKDVAKFTPADAQIYTAASQTPWNLKPVYGMTSDSLPIFGYHRTPYIILAGCIGLACFCMLGTVRLGSPAMIVTLLFGVNLSVASPDVMVDGIIAERSRQYPQFASDLQSLCWGCMSICAILAYLTSGYMIANFGSIAIFRILIGSSAIILVAGSLNWFGDIKKHRAQAPPPALRQKEMQLRMRDGEALSPDSSCDDPHSDEGASLGLCCWGLVEYDKAFIANHKNLFFLSAVICWCAIMLSVIMMTFQYWKVRLVVLASVFVFVSVTFYLTARWSGLPEVANAGLFIFLSNSVTPDIETAMFYWYTNAEEGPQFTPQFVGYISGLAFACMFAGILLYNRFLSTWPYRKIFACTMIFLAFMNLTDVVLVKRWNLAIGVPDEVMVLGDCALSPMARRFYIMPLYILAAKVCPSGAEATVFAILTALGNFGTSISVFFGSLVLQYFDIRDGSYDNLVLVIFLKCASRLLPLLLIPLLVPTGAPFEVDSRNNSESVQQRRGGGYSTLDMDSSHSALSLDRSWSSLGRRDAVVLDTTDNRI
mmetsp:Transcript_31348/g.58343  ORF Transcript_31348/g.58343 Transcript_31348/m.58343 type:complete len:551 (-) Transcript_31348:1096-2748(-)